MACLFVASNGTSSLPVANICVYAIFVFASLCVTVLQARFANLIAFDSNVIMVSGLWRLIP